MFTKAKPPHFVPRSLKSWWVVVGVVVDPRASVVGVVASVRCGWSVVVAAEVVHQEDLGAMAAVHQGEGACRILVEVVVVAFDQTAVVEEVAACQAEEEMVEASQEDPSAKVEEAASGLVVGVPLVEVASCRMAAGAWVVGAEACPWKVAVVEAVHRVGTVALVGMVAASEACHQAWVVVAEAWAMAALADLRVEVLVALLPGPREEEGRDQPQVVAGEAHPQGVHRQTADGVGPSGPEGSVQPADALLLIRAARPWSPF